MVRGHEKVPGYGQLMSPLVATKSPRFWPREVPPLTDASTNEAPWPVTVAVLTEPPHRPKDVSMKSVREHMDMHAAYREVGSYRGAAEICGTTPKTVKRSVLAAQAAEKGEIPVVEHNYDAVRDVVIERVDRTKGKMSAKRLLPIARVAGYSGSARNFRRLVAEVKAEWRVKNHWGRRPGIWTPGDMLVFDWGEIGPLFVFCAVMAWSRVRFVYFADNLGADSTMTALAGCFEYLGGVPKTALTDRMGCLKGDTVAGLVVPTPAYVRFATHYGFRPDFCEGADPESKGLVENLVGYVKSDLMIPEELSVADLARANEWAGLVRRGQRRRALGDLRDPRRATGQRARGDGDAAVTAGHHRQAGRAQGRPARAACASARPATRCPPSTSAARSSSSSKTAGPDHLLGRDHRRTRSRRPW